MASDYFIRSPAAPLGGGFALRALVVLLAALAGTALSARLGFWQLDRAAQRDAAQARLDAQAHLPVLDQAALGRTSQALDAQWQRRVRLEGEWLPRWTVALDNRPMDGRAGLYLLMPLRLGPDDVVLVQRGWLPRDAAERTRLAPHHTPAGKVVVEGHLRPEPARLYELAAGGDAGGVIRQNLEVAAFARESGLPLRPLLVVQAADAADAAGDDGLLRRWPAPSSGADKNRGYALQWFALAALITGLYVWFQLIRPRLAGRR